ncbi:tetratricopeptide repeat protein [Streptomyces sp. AS02]|uniref:tetratricopeptide repeat protein n=1 Tax=Streptomyces sp. AS02 TaxID=2938946 RepID=UPI00201FBFA8|nr:tetratricopeptide repeat protein [Streptomyces sp. AS02]MCL8018038.1 tetratricopeptide repeat protein [Streptomyces sp. AS02]
MHIGQNDGIVSLGDHAVNMLYRAERMTVVPPELLRRPAEVSPVGGVIGQPPLPAPLFVGREAELAALDEALRDARAGRRLHTVCGLDGLGKTTLTARYAATRGTEYAQVGWLRADSPGAVDDGLSRMALALEPHLAELPSALLRERALNWLSARDDWLLVLDEVTDREHVSELLARAPGGAFLLTTDSRSLAAGLGSYSALGPFPADTAESLLTAQLRQGGLAAEPTVLADICRALGHLPLAVAQAGAFLTETRLAPVEYLANLRSDPRGVYHEPAPGAPDNRSLVTVWRMTTERISGHPQALRVLAFLSWLAPEAIPRWLVATAVPKEDVDPALGVLAAHGLIDLSPETISVHPLLQGWYRTRTRAARRGEERIDEGFTACCLALAATLPQTTDPETWPRWRALLPQVEALQRNAPSRRHMAIVTTANSAGAYLTEQGEVVRSVALLEQAWTDAYTYFGIEHPSTYVAEQQLARVYQDAGRTTDLLRLRSRVLGAWVNAKGKEDEFTLTAMANVAKAHLLDGEREKPTAVYRFVLDTLLRKLGPDHKRVLRVRDDLADAYDTLGDLRGCLAELETNAAAWVRVQGPAHPESVHCRRHLADVRAALGDTAEAVRIREQLVRDVARTEGHDAPGTLTLRTDLAFARHHDDDPTGGVAELDAVIADSRRVLGARHPDTVYRRQRLADALLATGDTGRGVAEHRHVHSDLEAELGPEHRDVLEAKGLVGAALVVAGDFDAGISTLDETVAEQTTALGADDEGSLDTRETLVMALLAAGRVDRAQEAAASLAADSHRLLGPGHQRTRHAQEMLDEARAGRKTATPHPSSPPAPAVPPPGPPHPAVLPPVPPHPAVLPRVPPHPAVPPPPPPPSSAPEVPPLPPMPPGPPRSESQAPHGAVTGRLDALFEQAAALETAGALAAAAPLWQQLITEGTSHVGPGHPKVAGFRHLFALNRFHAEDYTTAIALLVENDPYNTAAFGALHPETLKGRVLLAGAYVETGQPDRGIPLYEAALPHLAPALGEDQVDTWRALFGLGTAYSHTGRHHEAIALYERCVAARPLPAPGAALAMTSLAVAHHMLGNTGRAAGLYTQILQAHRSQGRPEDNTTRNLRRYLKRAQKGRPLP